MNVDGLFHALADSTRRAVLSALRDGPLSAGRLAVRLHVAPNTLSFHLRVLRSADLIYNERRGQFIWYGLNGTAVEELMGIVREHFGSEVSRETSRKPKHAAGRPAVAVTSMPPSTDDEPEEDVDIVLL